VENVYIALQQIYLGISVPNFIRIAQVLYEILQKNILVSFFLGTAYTSMSVVLQHLERRAYKILI